MKKVIMVTGNIGKYDIAKEIFGKYNIMLLQEKIDTPEIQDNDVIEVSRYSALYAAKKLKKCVIKSDVGYHIESLGGFPGPFLKYINGMLSSEDILKMMRGKRNRTILLKECLTYATPKGEVKQYVNIEKARVSLKSCGDGSTFDKIVIFEGDKLPKSMNSKEKNFEHFKSQLFIYDKMAKYILGEEDENSIN